MSSLQNAKQACGRWADGPLPAGWRAGGRGTYLWPPLQQPQRSAERAQLPGAGSGLVRAQLLEQRRPRLIGHMARSLMCGLS